MAKVRFDDKAFRTHMVQWIEQVADNDLSRAWDVVVGCLAVHAKLDQEPKQSRAQAMREAYVDFVALLDEEPATETMIGLMRELEYCCPDHLLDDGTLYKVCREAMALTRGEDLPVEPDSPAEPPTLQLLEGGKV